MGILTFPSPSPEVRLVAGGSSRWTNILFELYQQPKGKGIMWPPFNHVFLKRTLESGYLGVIEPEVSIKLDGMRSNPDIVHITDKGRAFVESLGLHEL